MEIDLKRAVAPCALFCYTCFGLENGAVAQCAKKMQALNKGVYEGHVLAYGDNPTEEQLAKLMSIENFNKRLADMQCSDCPGCRAAQGNHVGCISGCVIPKCTAEHGVDYCGNCPEFPCHKNDAVFTENVIKKWLEGGAFIRDKGIEAYFEAGKDTGHYSEFSKD